MSSRKVGWGKRCSKYIKIPFGFVPRGVYYRLTRRAIAVRRGHSAMSETLSAVAASIFVSGFRPETDVASAENRYGSGRKQMWPRPKPLDGRLSRNGKLLCRDDGAPSCESVMGLNRYGSALRVLFNVCAELSTLPARAPEGVLFRFVCPKWSL